MEFDSEVEPVEAAPAPTEGAPSTRKAPVRWSFVRLALFWIAGLYLIAYSFPFPVSSLPTWSSWQQRVPQVEGALVWLGFEVELPVVPEGAQEVFGEWDSSILKVSTETATFWNDTTTKIGDDLGIEVLIQPTGSGDTTFAYLRDATRLVVAVLLGTLLALATWVFLGSRAPPRMLRAGLVVWARYYVGFTAISYGFFKVIKAQFPDPHLSRLVQPFGEASPMGLVWTFMGASAAYNWFTGGAEVLGGFLMLFRRTATAGALITAVVMANVVMLNFAYDVPVKLFSSHLMVIAFVIAALDWRRLVRVFFDVDAPARSESPLIPWPAIRVPAAVLAVVFQLVFITHAIWGNVDTASRYHAQLDGMERPELYGIWDVELLEVDGVELPPVTTDTVRWQRVIIEKSSRGSIRTMNGDSRATRVSLEEGKPRLTTGEMRPDRVTLRSLSGADERYKYVFDAERPSERELVLTGEVDGAQWHLRMTRRLPEDFLLMNRGFHWINEKPYNK